MNEIKNTVKGSYTEMFCSIWICFMILETVVIFMIISLRDLATNCNLSLCAVALVCAFIGTFRFFLHIAIPTYLWQKCCNMRRLLLWERCSNTKCDKGFACAVTLKHSTRIIHFIQLALWSAFVFLTWHMEALHKKLNMEESDFDVINEFTMLNQRLGGRNIWKHYTEK